MPTVICSEEAELRFMLWLMLWLAFKHEVTLQGPVLSEIRRREGAQSCCLGSSIWWRIHRPWTFEDRVPVCSTKPAPEMDSNYILPTSHPRQEAGKESHERRRSWVVTPPQMGEAMPAGGQADAGQDSTRRLRQGSGHWV